MAQPPATLDDLARLAGLRIPAPDRTRMSSAMAAWDTYVDVVTGTDVSVRSPTAQLHEPGQRPTAPISPRPVDHRVGHGLSVFTHVSATEAARPGPLSGWSIALKDNLADAGQPLACASRALSGHVAQFDATAVHRVRAAGASIVGRTNMDELGMGSSTETSRHGPSQNPAAPGRTPGGSSGGAAAAVAAGLARAALASDTGGSARQPAACCNVVGFKPTWGRVSRSGLVAFACSLDAVATITRDVADLRALWPILAGPDPRDATCSPLPARPVPPPPKPTGLTLGAPASWWRGPNDAHVSAALSALRARLHRAGVALVPVALPPPFLALATYHLLSSAAASSNLSRFAGRAFGPALPKGEPSLPAARSAWFGEEVQRRILFGTRVLLTPGLFDAAADRRAQIRDAVDDALTRCDALIGPTTPTAPRPMNRATSPTAQHHADLYTVVASLGGHPAISLPMPGTALPVGIQLVAPRDADETLISLADAVHALLQ